jgi:hypothetical protein
VVVVVPETVPAHPLEGLSGVPPEVVAQLMVQYKSFYLHDAVGRGRDPKKTKGLYSVD